MNDADKPATGPAPAGPNDAANQQVPHVSEDPAATPAPAVPAPDMGGGAGPSVAPDPGAAPADPAAPAAPDAGGPAPAAPDQPAV